MNRKGKVKRKIPLLAVSPVGAAKISKGCTCFGWHFFGEELVPLHLFVGGLR